MERNMYDWISHIRMAKEKKAMPILSFPAIQKMGISVENLILHSESQAEGMKVIADSLPKAAASVSVMDLSVEAECFGSKVLFFESEVPSVTGSIIGSEEDAENLQIPKIGSGRTGICIEAIRKASEQIQDRPVFAGVIGPFSLAGRLMDVTEAMFYCYDEPDMVHIVLEKATAFLIDYCKAFKKAGANGVLIAEPLAGVLSPGLAQEFSAEYVKRIVEAVQEESFIVIYHNCGNATIPQIDGILETGCRVLHFGNSIDMEEMLSHIPENIVVMGNVDPVNCFKNGTPESVKEETLKIMEKC